jgi:hypothetical protein
MPSWFWLLLVFLLVSGGAQLALRFPAVIPGCGLLNLTGIPCPLCGSTRALAAWSQLDWGLAWRMNPLVVLACVAGGGWLLLQILDHVLDQRWTMGVTRHVARLPLLRILGVAVAANWLYLLFQLPR